jgi:hypothetical protein
MTLSFRRHRCTIQIRTRGAALVTLWNRCSKRV